MCILNKYPGIKLTSPAVEVQSHNPWTDREIPGVALLIEWIT